jgi:hypothetical protein
MWLFGEACPVELRGEANLAALSLQGQAPGVSSALLAMWGGFWELALGSVSTACPGPTLPQTALCGPGTAGSAPGSC